MSEVPWTRRITTSQFAVEGLRLDVPHPVFGTQECKVWRVTITAIASHRTNFEHVVITDVSLWMQKRLAPHSTRFIKPSAFDWKSLKANEPDWLTALIERCRSEMKP